MSVGYAGELDALRNEIEEGGARPSAIDAHVDALMTEGNDTLAEDLLALLSDNAEYDEGMFTLIHAAESAADEDYVAALLSVFPTLSAKSPRWASIVLMRVLNSNKTQLELVRQLRHAPLPIKRSMHLMCERINDISLEFLSKTVPVMLAAA